MARRIASSTTLPSRARGSRRSLKASASSSTSCRVRRAPPPRTSRSSVVELSETPRRVTFAPASRGRAAGPTRKSDRPLVFRACPSSPRGSAARFSFPPRGGVMVEVRLEDDDRIEWAIKAFKRKVQKAGVLKDLKKKGRYMKPSEARQLKAQAARRRKRNPKSEK